MTLRPPFLFFFPNVKMESLPYSGFILEVGSQCTWLVKVQMGNVLSFACRGVSVNNIIGSLVDA